MCGFDEFVAFPLGVHPTTPLEGSAVVAELSLSIRRKLLYWLLLAADSRLRSCFCGSCSCGCEGFQFSIIPTGGNARSATYLLSGLISGDGIMSTFMSYFDRT
jgi:hypothetical protein